MDANFIEGFSSSQDLLVKSTAVSVIKVIVDLNPNKLFDDLTRIYYGEIVRVTRFNRLDTILTPELISKYFKTILKMHVDNVNDDRTVFKVERKYGWWIPTPLYSVLLNIGLVADKDFGLKFIPKFDIDSVDLLSHSEYDDVAEELSELEKYGLKFVTGGLPNKQDSGTLGFMGSQLMATGEVLSYRHDHPVYGFFRAMFDFNALEEILGGKAFRVRYGYYDEYSTLVSAFVRS
jgi:hypothetical protein